MNKKKAVNKIIGDDVWNKFTDRDFEEEDNIIDESLHDYNIERMKIFSANVNYFRQLIRLSDSLKPVERRILYSLYRIGALPNTKTKKSQRVLGETGTLHAHGDGPIYKAMVGLAQPWKNAVPLINGKESNFGNDINPEGYASSRYTEMTMSKYAYECFFQDYDEECVETLFNTSIDGPEPLSLPSKFPNVLINGGMGIAVGNAFAIPPYNINDIISLTKRLLLNPDDPDIYIIPDLPTGCDIVEKDTTLRDICDMGTGVLRMRSTIDIYEQKRSWVLSVKNVPWLVSLKSVNDRLVELTKKGILPIKDIRDESKAIKTPDGYMRQRIEYNILIDKAHDPYVVRDKIYKLTSLGKSMGINFKVVMEGFNIDTLNMRDLILAWVDERREYKRRLFNKRIIKIMARISLLEVLIHLTDKDNIEKTVGIIKNSTSSELVSRLMEFAKMSSFQATRIGDMRLNAFTKDARERYIKEKSKLEDELKIVMEIIKSEKKIDKIILEELDDLKKYASPRRSNVVAEDTSIQVAQTDHIIVVSNQGNVKKLLDIPNRTTYGSFKNLDYPMHKIHVNNLDSITFFDSLGRFTTMPVYEIMNTEMSSYGNSVYDVTKLDGQVIAVFPSFKESTEKYIKENLGDEIALVTLTKNGYLKQTKLDEFSSLKNTKNVRSIRLKDNDNLIYTDIILESSNLMVYTKKGNYIFICAKDIALQSKDSMGLRAINLEEGDECIGLTVIGKKDKYVLVITEKGNMKKCEIEYLGNAGKRRVDASYLTSLDDADFVYMVDTVNDNDNVQVCTRSEILDYCVSDIPTLTRRAKAKKMIPLPVGSNIITISVDKK